MSEGGAAEERRMETTGFDNREISWLKFNERVLDEAEKETVPLCERLFFLSVFERNQDEFFMVRVGALFDQIGLSEEVRENKTGLTAAQQIKVIAARVRRMTEKRDRLYHSLMEEAGRQGVNLAGFTGLGPVEEQALCSYFRKEIQPVLSPQIIARKQPFPFLNGGELYAAVSLETGRGEECLGLIPCSSRFFCRLIAVPGEPGRYGLAEELILHFAPLIFENYRVKRRAILRITRNADMDWQESGTGGEDYRDAVKELIWRRVRRRPVRLEITGSLPVAVLLQLCRCLKLDKNSIFRSHTPLDLYFVQEIRGLLQDKEELFYERFAPSLPDEKTPVWEQICEADRLLHYPYDSMKTFLLLLEKASSDPDVISIKMTLYRLAQESRIADILAGAAENGKEVLILLELGARFDEENNIAWSRRLEEAGCRVLYGLEGRKVHGKLCLITAKKGGQIVHVTQIGTGNYNEKTAGQYTDLSYLTADPGIGDDAARIFCSLSLGQPPFGCGRLLVSPCGLRESICLEIQRQAKEARAGKAAYIGMKMNALTDRRIIEELMKASSAGVFVELIVRGSCCIVAGIPGRTENIRVISMIGRFLEHSRLYLFGLGSRQKIYLGSADMMARSTKRRVEILTPVRDERCRERLRQMFAILTADNQNSCIQQADGSYCRRRPAKGEKAFDAQDYFCRTAREGREAKLPPYCPPARCLEEP